jgi:hypothetical protein
MSDRIHRIDEKRIDGVDTVPGPERHAEAVELVLASGAELRVARILLFDRASVERLLDLRVAAFALLQADPAGLPGQEDWAVTPALLVNAVNRHVSPKKADEAERLLAESESLAVELRAQGRDFPVGNIAGIEQPHPHLWLYAEPVVGTRREGLLLRREVPVEEERQWIHNGDAFVTVVDSDGQRRDVRWSTVEQYRIVAREQ